MDWTKTMFLDLVAWESGPFRILKVEEGVFELYLDRGIGTEVWRFHSLDDAKKRAEELSKTLKFPPPD